MDIYRERYTYLKGQCHEIFDFRFSTWINFPQAPDYTIRGSFRIFFEISGDTGDAPWLANISANFRMVLLEFSGAGGKLIYEKIHKQKISWHYPFHIQVWCSALHVVTNTSKDRLL